MRSRRRSRARGRLPHRSSARTDIAHATPSPINGTGSSFASPAIETWTNATHGSPYSLSVNWAPSNSGTGRYEFTNQTTDFAVSDIGYVGNTDTTPPSFPFNFIPITAGGIAFMYNVPGLSKQLQLSSLHRVCPADRRHQELERSEHRRGQPRREPPQLARHPRDRERLRRDELRPRGVVHRRAAGSSGRRSRRRRSPSRGVPRTAWPSPRPRPTPTGPASQGGLDDQSTTAVASDVANNGGAIGAVQVKYAQDDAGSAGATRPRTSRW